MLALLGFPPSIPAAYAPDADLTGLSFLPQLCATSTVGVAACGLTFGHPSETITSTTTSSHIQIPQPDMSSSHRASPVSFPSSATESRSGGRSPTNMTTSSQETTTPASSSTAGTKRKWYRRLSEAALKRRSITPPESSATSTSSFTDLARRLSVNLKGRSRSNTLKSLARSNSQTANVTVSAPENLDRPATYGPSFMRYGSLSSPSGSSLPFSFQSSVHSLNYQPEHVNDWQFYLQPRRVQFGESSRNMSPPRNPFSGWIKRIFPARRWKPTLVKPSDITQGPQEIPDIDYEDHRDIRSSYDGSRAASPATSAGGRSRRSLSISGFLSTSSKFGPGPNTRKRRRLSIIPSATYDPPGASDGFPTVQTHHQTPGGGGFHLPENMATVRLIPNDISPAASPRSPLTPIAPSQHQQDMLPTEMDLDPSPQDEDLSHARRPSLLVSERASTLIGSDDIEQDFLSDTVFDSLRTRASPTHPPKLDTLFNGNEQPPSRGPSNMAFDPSPINLDESMQGFSLDRSSWSIDEDPATGLTPTRPQTRSNPVSPFTSAIFNNADRDRASKDFDDSDSAIRRLEDDLNNPFKRNSKDRPVHSTFPRRRPHARNSSNLDAFDVSRKSAEIASVEGDRIVSGSDWSESFTKSGRSSREISSSGNQKSRQRAPSTHTRSRSMPVAGVFADSTENWDDDFDNDFCGDVIVPKSIKDAQATVMGHLGNVREFAKQVENLKKLVEKANARSVRNGLSSALWDEAEGIITLATVDDDVSISAIADPGTPIADSFDFGSNASQENIHLPRPVRRASVLLPDDDIFGIELFHSRNATPRLPQDPFLSSKPSSPALIKDEKKAVTNAKSIVARVQKREIIERPSKERIVPSPLQQSKAPTPENRLKFDTTSLQELVAHVKGLIRHLEEVLDAPFDASKAECQHAPNNGAKPETKPSEEEILLQQALFNYQEIVPAFFQEEHIKVPSTPTALPTPVSIPVPVEALLDLSLTEKHVSLPPTPVTPSTINSEDRDSSPESFQRVSRVRSSTSSRRRRSTLMTFV
ncbi:hypothetical protein DRE_01357 [Drechslerella stenobrocha 248]|uniref:Uncharacterized protein n=1 Tax=Drechslerella stenobrocha 248 TaxID=1043628 RepID=W7I5J7_9PEZI|nr:hypothetical protein DRE_01357 [Drechslerella stenobrocha 248]